MLHKQIIEKILALYKTCSYISLDFVKCNYRNTNKLSKQITGSDCDDSDKFNVIYNIFFQTTYGNR